MAYPGEKERHRARRAYEMAERYKHKSAHKHKKPKRKDAHHVAGYDPKIHSSLYDLI